jgi:hypothetical protein
MMFTQGEGSHYLIEVIGSLIDTKTWITDQITLGIWAQSCFRVHINSVVNYLDVGTEEPNRITATHV